MNGLPSMHSCRVIVFGVFFAVGYLAPFLKAQDAAPASHIGIVNLKLAYTNMQETIDFQHHLTEMQGQLTAMTDSHQAVLKQLQDKVTDSAKNGASAQGELIAAVDEQLVDFQRDEQTQKTKMLRAQNRQLKRAYDEIQAVVAGVAKSKTSILCWLTATRICRVLVKTISNPTRWRTCFSTAVCFTHRTRLTSQMS